LDSLIARLKSSQKVATPAPQKKNDLVITAATSPTLDGAELVSPTVQVEFRAGNEGQILLRLAERFADQTGTTLRRAIRGAIFGPNGLEIVLPASYDLARKACERPEVQSQIEAALREITGQPVVVRFRLEEPSTKPGSVADPKIRRVDIAEDIIVKEVAEKFGVQEWRVQELLIPAVTSTADRED
jgi:hypothetical protein